MALRSAALRHVVRWVSCVLAFWVIALWATEVRAQAGTPGGFGPDPSVLPGAGPPQPTQPSAPEGPETHAASGGDESTLPTEEAQLPEKPNEIPRQLRGTFISDFDYGSVEAGRERKTEREFYGLYYGEKSGDYSFKTILPPLWMERRQGDDRASLFGLTYFNRRSKDHDADVLFPFFWHLRDKETFTTVVGPFMHREGPKGHHNWLAPLFFEGSGEDGHEYLHIPPLLTFSDRSSRRGFQMAGPLFCWWRGGPRCDARTADRINMGIAPFYFYGRDDRSEYEVIPPLLHYYEYSEVGDSELNIWGPVWMENDREGGAVNVLPVFWHNWTGDDEAHTTLFPLFHYGYEGPNWELLATPLFVNYTNDDGGSTFATYVYARHRGRTELDMFSPLVWLYRDPDINLNRTVVFPFVYHETSNRSNNLAIFPFFAKFKRYGISTEWWVTPLVRHKTSLTGWQTDVYPIFYSGRTYDSTHVVVAPIFWDFAKPNSRSTVVFPLFWRFADKKGVTQVVGNTYYSEEKVKGGTDWEFHFFPAFSFGENPQGHYWNILYGLAGYTRKGTMSKMRILYIPITLSK